MWQREWGGGHQNSLSAAGKSLERDPVAGESMSCKVAERRHEPFREQTPETTPAAIFAIDRRGHWLQNGRDEGRHGRTCEKQDAATRWI